MLLKPLLQPITLPLTRDVCNLERFLISLTPFASTALFLVILYDIKVDAQHVYTDM